MCKIAEYKHESELEYPISFCVNEYIDVVLAFSLCFLSFFCFLCNLYMHWITEDALSSVIVQRQRSRREGYTIYL